MNKWICIYLPSCIISIAKTDISVIVSWYNVLLLRWNEKIKSKRMIVFLRYAMAVMNHHVCPVENW